VRSLTLFLLSVLLTLSAAARADDNDKAVCQTAFGVSDPGADRLAACTRFLASNTGTPRERGLAHDALAFAQFKLGRYDKALDEYTGETEVDPTNVNGYFMRARMYRLLLQYDKAVEAANLALQVKPGDWQSLLERGRAYAARGDLQAAAADYDSAAQGNPNLLNRAADILTTLGLARNEKKDFAAAIDRFDAALKIDPNNRDAIIGRCSALTATNASPDKINACSGAISEIDATACSNYRNSTEADRAAACARVFAATAPTGHALAIAHMWKGRDLKSKRQNDAAMAEFELAVKAAPDFWRVYDARAQAKDELKYDLNGALADYDEAIKRNPDDYNVYVRRGEARILKGDNDAAIADFDVAMPHFASPQTTLIDRARAENAKKDYDGAIADLNKAIDKPTGGSGLQYAYVIRARAFNGKGDSDAAIADCNAALKLNNKFAAAYDERGVAVAAKGDIEGALADLGAAIRLSPNFIKFYADRGAVYERKRDFDSARADYQVAMAKLTPYDSQATTELRKLARQRLAALAPPPTAAPAPSTPSAPSQPQKSGALAPTTRVALVIGNGAYKNVPKLPNPPKDATAVADSLRHVGFSVVTLSDDMPLDGFLRALSAFSRVAAKADWAVVYYAGHGMEIGGVNYLIPIDAKLNEDTDAATEAVSLELVIAAVSGAKKLRLVMLDACRDNPFAENMKRTIGLQLVNKGLSDIEPDAGIMIVYATKHGETAQDGMNGHSPFASAVINDIPKPGIEVRRLFDVVRDDVIKATNRAQQPFSYGSLPGSQEFYFVAGK